MRLAGWHYVPQRPRKFGFRYKRHVGKLQTKESSAGPKRTCTTLAIQQFSIKYYVWISNYARRLPDVTISTVHDFQWIDVVRYVSSIAEI